MSIDWIFGGYKILKKIATGGMAEVFLAKRVGVKGFEKLLAIKRILPQFSADDEFISMFIDEAKLAADLTHRNIVQIYDFGNQQDSYYIAMEYVFGKDLKSILKKSIEKQKRIPITQCAYIITEAARGLEYAHNLKDHFGNPLQIIHRDISPQNILISYEGEVMLADFGIAKAASKSTVTRAGVLKGKILYMSPEQAWGRPMDKRSDLYSLGVVLYETVTYRKILDADSEFSMLEKVRNAQVEFPPEVFEKVPKSLFHIMKKALEKNPGERYQTAHEMRLDLESYLLTTRETLSEKALSDYLKQLFQEEIEEEKKVLTERETEPIEETVSVGSVPQAEVQESEKRSEFEKVTLLTSLREALRKSDFRIRIGALLVLCILGGLTLIYLLTEKPLSSPSSVEVSSGPSSSSSIPLSPSAPSIKVDLPKEEPSRKEPSKTGRKPDPSSQKVERAEIEPPKESPKTHVPSEEKRETLPAQKTEKEASLKKPEPKVSTPAMDLVRQGPELLRENRHAILLEQIQKLPDRERKNIDVKILESFAHLKKWVLQKDKNSKLLWSNLYNSLTHSGNRNATPLLMKIANDPEEWTRLYAVSLLGTMGDHRALKELQQIAASDPNRRIRKSATKAISSVQSLSPSPPDPPSPSPPSE